MSYVFFGEVCSSQCDTRFRFPVPVLKGHSGQWLVKKHSANKCDWLCSTTADSQQILHTHTYIYIFTYIYTHIYMYTYIYTHIYTYIYICIYIWLHKNTCKTINVFVSLRQCGIWTSTQIPTTHQIFCSTDRQASYTLFEVQQQMVVPKQKGSQYQFGVVGSKVIWFEDTFEIWSVPKALPTSNEKEAFHTPAKNGMGYAPGLCWNCVGLGFKWAELKWLP